MTKIHTTKCTDCDLLKGGTDESKCLIDSSELERKVVPHDHGANEEFFLDGELVKRNCNVDLNLAKKVS